MARETFEEAVSELSEKHSWLADFVDTDINWGELEEHCEEEEENE
jgi:hypothetical protein